MAAGPSVWLYGRPRAINSGLAMLDPNFICALHYGVAIRPVWPVEVMNVNNPVPVHDLIVSVVNDDSGAEDTPGALHPGPPPAWIVLPAIRRSVNDILTAQNILNRFPIVHVDKIPIVRIVSSSAIGIPFYRFHDDVFPIEVFIPYNLKNGLISA